MCCGRRVGIARGYSRRVSRLTPSKPLALLSCPVTITSDLQLKLVPASSSSLLAPITFCTESKPPRALAFSPDGTFLLSTSCNGKLTIWNSAASILKPEITDDDEQSWEDPKVVKVMDGMFAASEPEWVLQTSYRPSATLTRRCRDILSTTPVWHPSGTFFVIPTKAHGQSVHRA